MSVAAKGHKESNTVKALARPTRFIDIPNEDHSSGLWLDHELLRKHMSSQAKFLIPADSAMAAYNHYLELADLALNNIETSPQKNWPASARQRKKAVTVNNTK